IRELRRIDPDVIHVHNLHNAYVCIPRLIKYVNRNHKALLCTLHDCWTFTGKCPHFIMSGCDKWIDGCSKCPSLQEYPRSFFDNSKRMWRKKKKWFESVERLYIATPSRWLLEQVNRSFLKNAKTCVIHNGIDLGVFRYAPGEFREKNCIGDKFVILGVSFSWSYKKGLDVFARLAKGLDDRFRIVLVGIDPETEKQLPSSVVCIQRTKSREELAGIYSAADLFVNPTREDTFPTVNMESIACGTPVLTFRTGGSTEAIGSKCGCSVECGDYDALREEILRIYETRPYARTDCIESAQAFDLKKSMNAYMKLYSEIFETSD
ncbi:MAG: glycosyltransferase, partial [Clostridia bacterium]|nr:glycosyltransferase [Clostridia bacterium]